ncbi:MAG: hypothetical protein AAGE61_06960 [Pseudomonadota bacterium]
MIRFFFRFVGYTFLIVSFIALLLDGVAYLASGEIKFMSAGQTWTDLAPATINQAQFAIQEHLGLIWLWDPVILWILLQPTFAVIGAFALFLIVIGLRPRRKRREFAA